MQSGKAFTQQRERQSVEFRASYDSPENRRALAELMGRCGGNPGSDYKDNIGWKSDQLWHLLAYANRRLIPLAVKAGLLDGDGEPRSTLRAWADFRAESCA